MDTVTILSTENLRFRLANKAFTLFANQPKVAPAWIKDTPTFKLASAAGYLTIYDTTPKEEVKVVEEPVKVKRSKKN